MFQVILFWICLSDAFLALDRMPSQRRAFNIQTFSVSMLQELIVVTHIEYDSTVLAFQLEQLDISLYPCPSPHS
jgi:hypothetical protein